jgi:hypothetical protein
MPSITSPSCTRFHYGQPIAYRRENGVIAIETEVVDQIERDLRVARVAVASRDSDRAARIAREAHFIARVVSERSQ